MEDAFKKATDGGYRNYTCVGYGTTIGSGGSFCRPETVAYMLLDPVFWKCLGKQQKWSGDIEKVKVKFNGFGAKPMYSPIYYKENGTNWISEWHKFINHLAEGGDTDDFFKSLLQ